MHSNIQIRTVTLIVIVTMVAVSTLGVFPVTASDDPPPPPHSFQGEVYVDGEPAPVGTEVVAIVNGGERGEIVVSEVGTYGGPTVSEEKLIVNGESEDAGAPITFRVDGQKAKQTVPWEAGGNDELHLVVGKQPEDPPGDGDNGGGGGLPPAPSGDGDGADSGDWDDGSTGSAGSGEESDGEPGGAESGGNYDDEDSSASMPGFGAAVTIVGVLVAVTVLALRE